MGAGFGPLAHTDWMQDFRKLSVWHKAMEVAVMIYQRTEEFPVRERYALSAQMRRSALSVTCNISEGCGRKGDREFVQFLHQAMGSGCELENCIELASRVGLLKSTDLTGLMGKVTEVKRMLASLIGTVNLRIRGPGPPAT